MRKDGRSRGSRLQHRHGEYADRAEEVEDAAPLGERPRHDPIGAEVGEIPRGVPRPAGRHDVEAKAATIMTTQGSTQPCSLSAARAPTPTTATNQVARRRRMTAAAR